MGSTRLPGKTFADLAGRPLIWHVANRVRQCRTVRQVVLATTTNPLDDPLAGWAGEQGLPVFRGSEEDVLARFHGAATAHGARVIVRITADDPFKDPDVIDQVVAMLEAERLDFAYNNRPPTFPEGLDTEVFTMAALEAAQREAVLPFDREHVTQFFYARPERFRQKNLAFDRNLSHLRWTIDTGADLELARAVYAELHREGPVFRTGEILALLERRPELATLNAEVARSAMYQNLPKE